MDGYQKSIIPKSKKNHNIMKNIFTTIIIFVLCVLTSNSQSFEFRPDWAYVPAAVDLDDKPVGFLYRSVLLCGPKIDDERYRVQDTVPLYDVYAMKGKSTRILGIVQGDSVPYVVFELGKDAKMVADMKVEKKLQDFLGCYGWGENENINFAFLPQQKLFLKSIMAQSTPVVAKKIHLPYCYAYDFHSQSALFRSSGLFLVDVFKKSAIQDFIDNQAHKAKYSKSTAYSDLKNLFDEKDPETVEFVSKFLTWAGKWDKKTKKWMQNAFSEYKKMNMTDIQN